MPRSGVSVAECPGGCQVLGLAKASLDWPIRSAVVAEAVRLGGVVSSWCCPFPLVHHLTVNAHKAVLGVFDGCRAEDKVSAFRQYREKLAEKVVIVENLADKSVVKVIRQAAGSRYFPEGRKRIRAKIARKMGGFGSCNGYMLTLTFDPKMISREAAWREVGERGSRFMRAVNLWRRRKGWSKVRGIRGLEEQPSTGYPHLHYAFPKLRYLADIGKMVEWWGQAVNSVDYSYRDSFSPVGYVCKYISKLEGWSDEALAEIWGNRSRVYSMSSDYYLVADERCVPGWVFLRTAKLAGAGRWLRELIGSHDTVLGANDLAMEVYLDSS